MNDGVILINKPINYTSRDIVNLACKKLHTKKIGHCGTLDPLATGVLVLCVGNATKLVPFITSSNKKYRATMILGILTTTADLAGEVISENFTNYSDKEIYQAFNNFPSSYLQEVPIYSAVKVNGKKLYEYARNNEFVELPSRNVDILELSIVDIKREANRIYITFDTVVSKGTYIRSLCIDLAKSLNTYSVMSNLIRLEQGEFKISDCLNIDEELNVIDINSIVLPFPRIDLTFDQFCLVKNGVKIVNDAYNSYVALYYDNVLYAIYEPDGDYLKCKRGINVGD